MKLFVLGRFGRSLRPDSRTRPCHGQDVVTTSQIWVLGAVSYVLRFWIATAHASAAFARPSSKSSVGAGGGNHKCDSCSRFPFPVVLSSFFPYLLLLFLSLLMLLFVFPFISSCLFILSPLLLFNHLLLNMSMSNRAQLTRPAGSPEILCRRYGEG